MTALALATRGLAKSFGSLVVASDIEIELPAGVRYALIAVLAATMGVQNAAARKLAVPDLTTTVLTLTITGIAADGPLAGAAGAHVARRLISVLAMFVGALVGAVLVLHARIVYPLAIALFLLAVVALAALARANAPHAPPPTVS